MFILNSTVNLDADSLKGLMSMEALRGLWQWSPRIIFAAATMSLVSVLWVTLVWSKLIQSSQRRRRQFPPGPQPWPVLGNLPALAGLPYRSLQKLATEYGGLMYLRLGSVPCIVVSTAAVMREIFQTQDATFSSRPKLLAFKLLKDDQNMATSPYGPYWRQLRRIAKSELFSPQRHASYENGRAEEIRFMLQVLVDESRMGEAINLKSWLHGVTDNIMTRMLMNKRFFGLSGTENKQEKEDFDLVIERTLSAASSLIISDYVPYLWFIPNLQGWPSKFQKVCDFKEQVARKIIDIEGHRERTKLREISINEAEHVPDFVDILLAAPLEDGKPLPDLVITMLVLELLTAGTDTSATTVEWAMSELMLHPHLIKQAQDELDVVVGVDRLVQESDIPKLPYLQAIVKETFRTHPPVPLSLPRESTCATQVLGYDLPAHTRQILNLFAIHRDPAEYENPDTFDPNRFLKKHSEVDHTSGYGSYQLMPFGVGRRMCPGYHLGDVLVHLMLGNMLHSFNWSLPKGESVGGFDMTEVMSAVVGRKNPLHLVAMPRLPPNSHFT